MKQIFRLMIIGLGAMAVFFFASYSAFAVSRPEIFVQMGHTRERVNAVAFSPDGKYAFTGGWDHTVKMWEVASGREVRTLYGTAKVTAIAVSPDGGLLISGDEDYKDNLKLWDLKTGKVIRAFSGHEPGMEAIAALGFSADGRHFLSAGGREIKRWDIATGKALWAFTNDSQDAYARFTAMVLSPDGRFVVSGMRSHAQVEMADGTRADAKSAGAVMLVLDAADGRRLRAFNDGGGWVEALAVCPDGRHVISADHQDGAKMWDFTTGRQVKAFSGEGVSTAAVSPDGSYALFGGVMTIRLWDIGAAREIRTFTGHNGWLRSVAFSPDGRHALSGSDDNMPRLWDVASGKVLRSFGGYARQVAAVAAGTTGHTLLIAQNAGLLSIWDVPTGSQTKTMAHTLGVSAATLSRDGKYAAAGGWNFPESASTVKLWDVATGGELGKLTRPGASQWARPAAITSDNRNILWSVGPTLLLSEVATGKVVRTFSGHEGEIEAAALSDNGAYALSRDALSVKIWDVAAGRVLKTYADPQRVGLFYAGTFSPDGKKVLLLEYGGGKKEISFKFRDMSSNRETILATLPHELQGYINLLSMSPDGRYALWAEKTVLRLYDFSTGGPPKTIAGHVHDISSLGISSDGKFAYSGSHDGTTRIWNIATGREVAQFIGFTDGEWIAITPEGYFNASPNGARRLNVRVGMNVYAIDNFYEKFFHPVYVASVLQGKEIAGAADIRRGVLSPPEVRIISPAPGTESPADAIAITVSARDTGGGIDEIRLYHNGKAIGDDTRAVKLIPATDGETRKEFRVSLVEGINIFRAVGFSMDRTESNPYELTVKLAAPAQDVSLYVFAVGINKYKNPALNLNYAEPDARGIAAFFQKRGPGLFKNVAIREIYNEQATRENILSQLDRLQGINARDAVLIYLAGHGENVADKWYFIPHELTYPEREGEVKTRGISSDELSEYIKNIKAQKILMLIDACKSGAVLVAFRGFEDRKALSQLSRSTGVHIVAAATKDQYAAEVKDLGHGVFTYTLLEGLNGKAAAGKGDAVTVRRLMSYVEEQLPEITKKYKQEAQYPVVDSRGMDFPLATAR